MTITEPDREAFRKMVPVVWKEFAEKVPAAAALTLGPAHWLEF